MKVFIRNHDGAPLMPCTPAKARKLLRAGTASVVARSPFTIQLGWQCEGQVQEVVVGIDKGSSVTGLSCVGNGEVLLSAEIHHRRDVKEKLDTRRAHRRDRRLRKWYRPARFLNRASSKRSGRLPPSIRTNVEEVIRVARDENLRIACLMRDGYRCRHCGTRKSRLEAHHIVYREHGGKDTLANLLTLCERCHGRVHDGTITLSVTGVSGHLDQIAQRSMQGKSYLYATLGASVPLTTVFGYETSAFRKRRGLGKAHTTDALCVATLGSGEIVSPECPNTYQISFRPRQTRRRFHDLPRKGQGRVRYQVNEELAGFRKGDIVRVKGRWIKQINSIYSTGYLAFKRVPGEPTAARLRDCRLLERGRTIVWEQVA